MRCRRHRAQPMRMAITALHLCRAMSMSTNRRHRQRSNRRAARQTVYRRRLQAAQLRKVISKIQLRCGF